MSNKINITNYEAFLLDYMEGNLSGADIALLKEFVLTHPELNIDLNDTELVELEAENVSFNSKENLKKTNSQLVPDELFVGYIENTLNAEERNKIEELCAKDPSLANELRLFKSTISIADKNIVFENKESLKKENKIIWFSTKVYFRAAAALLLLFGLWFTFRNIGSDKTNKETIIANNSVKENNSNSNTNTVSVKPNEEKQNAVESFTVEKNNLANKKNDHSPKTPVITNLPEPNIVNNVVDTVKPKEESKLVLTKIDTASAPTLVINNSNAVNKKIVVVEEADDEPVIAGNPTKEKKGFWYRAGKLLSGINKMGVKQVDGKDQSANNNEQYVLSLGNFSVEKNTFNKE